MNFGKRYKGQKLETRGKTAWKKIVKSVTS
ncbi:unknown [Eubacterium sp. CAG:38]|nr:unknown [Eubacterium sp. CAG:38]